MKQATARQKSLRGTILSGFLLCCITTPAFTATFTVNSILDTPDTNPGDGVCEATSGGTQCTLRAAIEESNANAQITDFIEFSLGLITINITGSPLPTLTSRVTIDGRTAPSYNNAATGTADAPPSVYINGSGLAGTTADGFRIANALDGNNIFAIGIIGFPDNGIEVITTDAVTMDGNWIGTGRSGAIAGNGGAGVYIDRCDRCEVGQTLTAVSQNAEIIGVGNLIANNGEDGIHVILGGENIIAGNWIGVDAFSGQDHGNGRHGIFLEGPNNKVGQINFLTGSDINRTTPNLIWNNNADGIRAQFGGQSIFTNQITNNGGNGVVLNGSGSRLGIKTLVGGGNLIIENGIHGVVVGADFASHDNLIETNRIFQNTQRGVFVSQGDRNTIDKNIIYQNSDAVRLDTADNVVKDNSIGVADNGTVQGNDFNGVVIAGSTNTVSGNLISGQSDDGIDVVSGDGSTISNNRIGVGPVGQNHANANMGIRVRAPTSNLEISGNQIGFNLHGIRLEGGSATRVENNLIGTGPTGEDRRNTNDGITVLAAATQTKIISNNIGHNLDGIRIEAGGVDLCGNSIGFGDGTEPAGNRREGIILYGAGNRVGDVNNSCAGNFLGDNSSDGIEVHSDANIIRNNFIGTFAGNGAGGVLLWTGTDLNEISGNQFSGNGLAGVRIGALAGTRNRIEQNFFQNNGGIPIDLLDNGATANDAGDIDSGPNNLQNFPVIVNVTEIEGGISVDYRVDSNSDRAVYPLAVDFYRTNSNQSVHTFLVRDTYGVSPNAIRNVQFDPGFQAGIIAAMVIDSDGNSSEFGLPVLFNFDPVEELIFADGFEE